MPDAIILKNQGFVELTNDELCAVEGGIGFLAAVAGAAAVLGLAYAAYNVGVGFGKALFYLVK